ncbi:PEP-CTERM sorting domain-containing protein [Pseudaquabacterium rugosum]|uniref:PEP-CTERM sorting domain-containing protein n=1 Tax=Pseudaquabacterium rugosum TaxID=2984194 RepID=A0ABU9BE94_9BURK
MRSHQRALSVGVLSSLLSLSAWAVDPPLVPPPPVTVTSPVWNAGLHQWSWEIHAGGDGIASIHVTPAGAEPPITVGDLPGFIYTPGGGLLGEQPPYNWETPGRTPNTGNLSGDFNLKFRSDAFTGQETFSMYFDYLWESVDPDTGVGTVYRTDFQLPAEVISTSVVPEPSGAALMILGSLGLGLIARRRGAGRGPASSGAPEAVPAG